MSEFRIELGIWLLINFVVISLLEYSKSSILLFFLVFITDLGLIIKCITDNSFIESLVRGY